MTNISLENKAKAEINLFLQALCLIKFPILFFVLVAYYLLRTDITEKDLGGAS